MAEREGRGLPAPSWREWGLWLLRRRTRLRVTGDSMRPILKAGDLVLVDTRAYTAVFPQVGHIVVARHPYQRDLTIIKRVTAVSPEGRVDLRSDNAAAGQDSRQFGPISSERLIGRVTAKIEPAA